MSSSTTREEGIAATDHEAWNGSTKTNDTPRRNLSALEESYMYMKGLRNTWWYDFQQVDAKELVTKLIRYVFTFNGGARTEEEWEALRRLVLIRQCEYCTQRSFPIRLHTYMSTTLHLELPISTPYTRTHEHTASWTSYQPPTSVHIHEHIFRLCESTGQCDGDVIQRRILYLWNLKQFCQLCMYMIGLLD